jgi:CBS domain-containing protein
MKAQDVMTLGVISVQSNASVMRAVQLMLHNKISGLPVVDDKGSLVGIVTEGDFLRRGELGTQRKRPRWLEFLVGPGRLAEEYVHACGRKVDEVMTPEPYTVSVDTPVNEIVRLMEKHSIKRLPVVENGKPIGMVSRANLLTALARATPEVAAPTASDVVIWERISAECAKQPWASKINVVVKQGIVELRGAITDERERQAFIVAVENVPGVKTVHDHLVWVDGMSGMVFLSQEDELQSTAS